MRNRDLEKGMQEAAIKQSAELSVTLRTPGRLLLILNLE